MGVICSWGEMQRVVICRGVICSGGVVEYMAGGGGAP